MNMDLIALDMPSGFTLIGLIEVGVQKETGSKEVDRMFFLKAPIIVSSFEAYRACNANAYCAADAACITGGQYKAYLRGLYEYKIKSSEKPSLDETIRYNSSLVLAKHELGTVKLDDKL